MVCTVVTNEVSKGVDFYSAGILGSYGNSRANIASKCSSSTRRTSQSSYLLEVLLCFYLFPDLLIGRSYGDAEISQNSTILGRSPHRDLNTLLFF